MIRRPVASLHLSLRALAQASRPYLVYYSVQCSPNRHGSRLFGCWTGLHFSKALKPTLLRYYCYCMPLFSLVCLCLYASTACHTHSLCIILLRPLRAAIKNAGSLALPSKNHARSTCRLLCLYIYVGRVARDEQCHSRAISFASHWVRFLGDDAESDALSS